jgi:hypothetical protein
MTKRARVSGLYLEVLLRVLLSRKTSLHLGAPAVSGYYNITSHFDRYNILTDKQHEFRSKHSCETQLVTTIQKIAQISKGQVDVILLDFDRQSMSRIWVCNLNTGTI